MEKTAGEARRVEAELLERCENMKNRAMQDKQVTQDFSGNGRFARMFMCFLMHA